MPQALGKNIVLVGPAYPYRGGIAHFLESMYEGLCRRSHRVSTVTFSRQYPDILFPGATQYAEKASRARHPAERLIDSVNPLSWFRTARGITEKNPDAVVFQYWLPFFAPAYGVIARRLKKRGIKVLSVVHNALPHEKRPGDRVLSRYFLRSNDALLVLSESVEHDLDTLGVRVPCHRVAHPVYQVFGDPIEKAEARRRLELPAQAPVLLFFGFVRPYKGLRVLLEAMPSVLTHLPEARLVVAGECYDDASIYRNLVEKLGISRQVRLRLEYIPDEVIPALFSAADVVVQPYTSATQSGVAQIAFHFARPLIVTDVGALAETVPDGVAGLVVPPENSEALADAITRFFKERMGEKLMSGIREVRKKFSWDRLFEELEQCI